MVDAHGNKIEPFYSAYLKHAQESSTTPLSEEDAAYWGYTMTEYNAVNTSIVGVNNVAKKAIAKYGVAPYTPSGPYGPTKHH